MTSAPSSGVPRKAHLYCVGTAKSGTHSIAEMFQDRLRSEHEPENRMLMKVILRRAAGEIDDQTLAGFLLERERRLNLDVDSSQLNFFVLEQLIELFPESRFLLTIRDPYTWLDSLINHQLSSTTKGSWLRMRELRFRPDLHRHPAEEAALSSRDLYALDGYFSYWAHHNRTVLDRVPVDRLLVVRTDQISASIDRIAGFCGVAVEDARREKSHAFRAGRRFHVLEALPQDHLERKVAEHCGDLLARYFPEIRTMADAFPASAGRQEGVSDGPDSVRQ